MASDWKAHLRADERVVSSFGPYHATSQRILLYLETDAGVTMQELPYSNLEQIELVRVADHRVMASGAALSIVGFLAAFLVGLVLPLIVGVAGVAAVLYGGSGKPGYYQLSARGISDRELRRWRIQYRGAGSFIASIRTITGHGASA